jgi:hypothetical protein
MRITRGISSVGIAVTWRRRRMSAISLLLWRTIAVVIVSLARIGDIF